MNALKKKEALDKSLNESLYKLGQSYGKRLVKIYAKKSAQDIAVKTAKNIIKTAKKSAKDADNDKWRYSKNVLGMGLDPGAAITGYLADKLIKNKKPSYLKDALVEGVVGGLASRWLANKLYAPMPKSDLGKNQRRK